jgi:hypothetical protein
MHPTMELPLRRLLRLSHTGRRRVQPIVLDAHARRAPPANRWNQMFLPAGTSSRALPVSSRRLPPPQQNMGIARYGAPAGRARMGRSPKWRRVKREPVVNEYSRMSQGAQIPIVIAGARRASGPVERTLLVSLVALRVDIRASVASSPIRRPDSLVAAALLPIALEGVAVTPLPPHHSRRSPVKMRHILLPVGRIIIRLSRAGPMVGTTPTTSLRLMHEILALHMTGPANQGARYVVAATPISSPGVMSSGIRVHPGSRPCVLPVQPTTTDVNRD